MSAHGPRKVRASSASAVTTQATRQSAPMNSVRISPAVSMSHELSDVYGSMTTTASWKVVSQSSRLAVSPLRAVRETLSGTCSATGTARR